MQEFVLKILLLLRYITQFRFHRVLCNLVLKYQFIKLFDKVWTFWEAHNIWKIFLMVWGLEIYLVNVQTMKFWSNLPIIGSLKILRCATIRDSLLLATLRYLKNHLTWKNVHLSEMYQFDSDDPVAQSILYKAKHVQKIRS